MTPSIPQAKNVNAPLPTGKPLPGSRMFFLAPGLRCRCGTVVENDPEVTDDGHRVVCRGCHQNILSVERYPR